MTAETLQAAYNRGVVDTRLDHHDEQIKATNTVLAKTVDITAVLTATVQTLTEARVTDAATRVATADAVKEAKNAQEAQASSAWSPIAKLVTIVLAVVGVLGFAVAAYALFI